MPRKHRIEGWGPSHQDEPPRWGRGRRLAIVLALAAVLFELVAHRLLAQGLLGALRSSVEIMLRAGLAGALIALALALLWNRPTGWRRRAPGGSLGRELARAHDPALAVREHAASLGGGAFLGLDRGDWVTADGEHAVLVLGPPRSGKTSAVVIPALLAAPGAAICTSTKPDVLHATARARAGLGQVWLFDPTAQDGELPPGVRRLRWSPLTAAGSWDQALLMARAMSAAAAPGAGTTNESHWRERSAALLAPLLLAANLGGSSITALLRWVLRGELEAPGQVLTDHEQEMAADVLAGIVRTDARERSSILSATSGVLSAYNADGARRAAERANFDAQRFIAGDETIYVSAPAHGQAMAAPLVLGLLEQIRNAAYARARSGEGPPVFMCLDELANIAPMRDLPALVSEAGGQGLHVLACLQDLSQARTRWGEAADGLLSLFQTKLILDGIADSRTLEAISLALGE